MLYFRPFPVYTNICSHFSFLIGFVTWMVWWGEHLFCCYACHNCYRYQFHSSFNIRLLWLLAEGSHVWKFGCYMAVKWLCQILHVLFTLILLHSKWILNDADIIFLHFSSVLNHSLIISGKTSIWPTHSTPCAILSKHWFFFFLTIVFLCLSLAVSDYRQSLQFQNLNKEKQNIQLEVCVEVMKIFYCLFFYLLAFGV